MKSDALSRSFHKWPAALLMLVIACAYTVLAGFSQGNSLFQGDQGIGLPSPDNWPLTPLASMLCNEGLTILIMAMMIGLNRTYNVLRSMTWLPVGLFAIMQAAVPREIIFLSSGTLLCLVVSICLFLIFSTFDNPVHVRTVFLTFLLLSLGSAVQYCFIFFIPVFWIVCMQMRVFTARGFIGSLLGIATVWVILLGFGLVSPSDIHIPHITNLFEAIDLHSAMYLLTVVAITTFIMVISIVANLMKTIAYNARARAYNGAILVVSLASVLAMVFDYDNMLAYLPLLNMCAAFQITHYFVNHLYERQYIAILAIITIYVALYLWRLTII